MAKTIGAAVLVWLLVGQVAFADETAPNTLRFMVYRNAAEIESAVSARQAELGASIVHYSLQIQFGTEVEWQNACSWLESQTENASKVFVPAQTSVAETKFYCLYWQRQSSVSVQAISEAQALIDNFVTSFGGSPAPWLFVFED
ncbi:MAG: hypothetical protein AAGH76_15000 [Pseudomonadota bacterium]